ncbi:AsnC family transcriptional regulator [Halarchaeum sp. P4]|uniref:AsnC family transcriptional regulator n=1 Tax=Halarchaeum sp. P4 TaxID=3421639 RepID=UPI003EC1409D
MRDLDDIDREILRLLAEDARRPYSEIAEAVDRSPPTVSDRIDRLEELGVVRRFTVDVDWERLATGTAVLLDLSLRPGSVESVRDALADADGVQYVYTTADARIVVHARVPDGDPRAFLSEHVDFDDIRQYDVSLLSDTRWTPGVGDASLSLECAQCGNTVTAEGEVATVDGTRYHFCCPSCRERFVAQAEGGSVGTD